MRDAVRQKAYSGEGKNPKKRLENKDLMDELKPTIDHMINSVLQNSFKSQTEYNTAFLNATIIVCDIINRNKQNHFKFGNAQKLINMIIKYFYILSYNNNDIRKGFKYCHCPMDEQLLENVWKEKTKLKNTDCLGERDSFLKSWGKEDFDIIDGERKIPLRYTSFQNAVKELAKKEIIDGRASIALEYDFIKWGT